MLFVMFWSPAIVRLPVRELDSQRAVAGIPNCVKSSVQNHSSVNINEHNAIDKRTFVDKCSIAERDSRGSQTFYETFSHNKLGNISSGNFFQSFFKKIKTGVIE